MKSFIFFRYLYISIVFFSCVICAAESGLLNMIQKCLNRYCTRGHDFQRKLQQCLLMLCCVGCFLAITFRVFLKLQEATL